MKDIEMSLKMITVILKVAIKLSNKYSIVKIPLIIYKKPKALGIN